MYFLRSLLLADVCKAGLGVLSAAFSQSSSASSAWSAASLQHAEVWLVSVIIAADTGKGNPKKLTRHGTHLCFLLDIVTLGQVRLPAASKQLNKALDWELCTWQKDLLSQGVRLVCSDKA